MPLIQQDIISMHSIRKATSCFGCTNSNDPVESLKPKLAKNEVTLRLRIGTVSRTYCMVCAVEITRLFTEEIEHIQPYLMVDGEQPKTVLPEGELSLADQFLKEKKLGRFAVNA